MMVSFGQEKRGKIVTITGPVHSGKKTELEYRLQAAHDGFCRKAGKNSIVVVGHPDSSQNSSGLLGGFQPSVTDNPDDISELVQGTTSAVVISGVNLFTTPRIVDLVRALALSDRVVFVSGNNLDWNSEPYNHMPAIMAYSDEFVITTAPCIERDCQLRATRNREMNGGERVCIDHHYFKGRPNHRPFLKHQTGGLELFAGSMFGQKSRKWYRRMLELRANHIDFEVFKWINDRRYSERGKLYSPFDRVDICLNSSEVKIPAIAVRDAHDIIAYIECRTGKSEIDESNRERMMRLGHIFVDEGQFMKDLYLNVRTKMYEGYKFYVTGLLRNWKMEPFGEMARLLTVADTINVAHGYCEVCGRVASESQRLIKKNGRWQKPHYTEDEIAVGGKESKDEVETVYEARCSDCTEVPEKPSLAYGFDSYKQPNWRKVARSAKSE